MRNLPQGHQLLKFIIKKFVKSKNIPWGYEINQAKKLVKFENNPYFWVLLKDKQLKSLDWLLTFEGKKFLFNQKRLFKIDKNSNLAYNIGKDKIGEDKNIIKKVKTLKEFLDGKT